LFALWKRATKNYSADAIFQNVGKCCRMVSEVYACESGMRKLAFARLSYKQAREQLEPRISMIFDESLIFDTL